MFHLLLIHGLKAPCAQKQNPTVLYTEGFSIRVSKYSQRKGKQTREEFLRKLGTFGMLQAFNQLLPWLLQLKTFMYSGYTFALYVRARKQILVN